VGDPVRSGVLDDGHPLAARTEGEFPGGPCREFQPGLGRGCDQGGLGGFSARSPAPVVWFDSGVVAPHGRLERSRYLGFGSGVDEEGSIRRVADAGGLNNTGGHPQLADRHLVLG
jgi:hypothetical protein